MNLLLSQNTKSKITLDKGSMTRRNSVEDLLASSIFTGGKSTSIDKGTKQDVQVIVHYSADQVQNFRVSSLTTTDKLIATLKNKQSLSIVGFATLEDNIALDYYLQ